MQLKEVYAADIQERKAISDENRRLKELLELHGISYSAYSPAPQSQADSSVFGLGHSPISTGDGRAHHSNPSLSPLHTQASGTSVGYQSRHGSSDLLGGSQQSMYAPQDSQSTGSAPQAGNQQHLQQAHRQQQPQTPQQEMRFETGPSQGQQPQYNQQHQNVGLDHEQLGVDFVLASVPQNYNSDAYDAHFTSPNPRGA